MISQHARSTTRHWYAVRCHQRALSRRTPNGLCFDVEDQLIRRGFAVFVPTKTVWRRRNQHAPVKRRVLRPLLGSWLFVGVAPLQPRWADLFDVHGVLAVVGVDGVPYCIPPAVMADLFARWGETAPAPDHERFARPGQVFDIGDRVRVADGPLAGFTGRVIDLHGPRAKAVFELLGSARSVEIATALLEVA